MSVSFKCYDIRLIFTKLCQISLLKHYLIAQINILTLMTKRKTNHRTNILHPQRTFQEKTQMTNNESIMNMHYLTVQQTTVSRCWQCKALDNSPLLSMCDCLDHLFHEMCSKQWLKAKVDASGKDVTTQNGISSIKCETCQYDIKFRLQSKSRVRSCKEIGGYCSAHKGITMGIILSIILILACLTYILLLILGGVIICACNLEKQVLLIALGVISSFLLMIVGCCCLDCIRVKQNRIYTIYNRDGKSHRCSRSRRSNCQLREGKLVVESIQ